MADHLTRECPRYLAHHYSRRNAAEALADFEEGREVLCLTHGQFSLSDAIEHLAEWAAPLDRIDIATWTAAGYDAARMINLVEKGICGKMRWLVDNIFVSRQPRLSRELIHHGSEIRIMKTHAKFCVFIGRRSCVLRTSMNLNANPRMEFLEVSACKDLAAFFGNIVDLAFANDKNQRVRLSDIPDDDANEAATEWQDIEL